ncbi:phospholipase [Lysobacter sp. 5GHs7-4]|uniref:alpha/beta hydrolase n=1 Tax=Lysobacter sp. 5GHs7-4 TaxID=2904253 RepID=UPI001E5ADDFD|nr:phospholipase [Lysobacter sp. 5GHs7-4]UHQ24879.1 phospholipase [Lysobacter sp. 5GHs7-4]
MSAGSLSALRTDAALPFRIAGAMPSAPRRLLLLAHGVGGNETNLAALGERFGDDTLVVLPRAPLELGAGQYAWFQVAFGPQGPRPDLDAAERSRRGLADFIAELQSRYRVAASQTVVAGFSQGGIVSASVGLTRPELLRGFGVLAGRILPEIEPLLADRASLARIAAFVGHGRDDSKLPVEWAHRAEAWLSELGVAHETRVYPGDHAIAPAMAADFHAWFARLTRV